MEEKHLSEYFESICTELFNKADKNDNIKVEVKPIYLPSPYSTVKKGDMMSLRLNGKLIFEFSKYHKSIETGRALKPDGTITEPGEEFI